MLNIEAEYIHAVAAVKEFVAGMNCESSDGCFPGGSQASSR